MGFPDLWHLNIWHMPSRKPNKGVNLLPSILQPRGCVLPEVNDGDYAMFIPVTEGDIKPNEDGNPVKTLRLRYDAWKKASRP